MSVPENKLVRGLSLSQATAINMIDMVGMGPFVTIPLIVTQMHGSAAVMAWLIGALLAYMDGMVWAELGAKWPDAGGSYVFLKKLYGEQRGGKFMSFLFIWQTTLQAPLVIASGAIGFANYFAYLVPVNELQQKMVSGGLVILLVIMLYRNIKSVGKISIMLGVVTVGTILWLIVSGIPHSNLPQIFSFHINGFESSSLLYFALGHSTLKATYSYLGYYNVCHLGAEIKDPAKNIPRSILLSITGIAILYLGMQAVIVNVLSPEQAKSNFAASLYFEQLYNHTVGQFATVLILIIGLSSLFSAILGYSRIPYSAAANGDFFEVFAKIHPRYKFPHISLLLVGGLGFIFSLLFRLGDAITAILTMRILVQFVSQAIGVILWHYKKPADERPYRMPLFPLPAILSIIIWLFIYSAIKWQFIAASLGIIAAGIVAYFIRERLRSNIP